MSSVRKTVSKTTRKVCGGKTSSTNVTTTTTTNPRPNISKNVQEGTSRLPRSGTSRIPQTSKLPVPKEGVCACPGPPKPKQNITGARSSFGGGPPRGAIPKATRPVTSRTTTNVSTSKQAASVSRPCPGPRASRPLAPLPAGQYIIPPKQGPGAKRGREMLSSPAQLRSQLEQRRPVALQTYSNIPRPGTYKDPHALQSYPGMQDILSGNLNVQPAPPPVYGPSTRAQSYFEPGNRSFMNYSMDPSSAHVQFNLEESTECSCGDDSQGQSRRSGSPPLTPPAPGPRRSSPSGSPPPLDYSRSSLEKLVGEELQAKISTSPGSPARAKGSKTKVVAPPVIMTPEGPIQGTHKMILERTVNRLPDMEVINRRMIGIETNVCGGANQIELNVQNIEHGGLNVSMQGQPEIPLHEVISVTSSITVGLGIREKTTKITYEKAVKNESKEMKGEMDPAEVLEMIKEENKDVEEMQNLEPPELKGSATDSFGLKKKLQKLKLFPESVRHLESLVINPPPNADEPQEELQPELMAAIMHAEERGLTMDSPPDNLYTYLFPDVKDDLVIEISSVAPAPLQNVVIPVTVPSQLHTAGVTPEIKRVAEATRCSQRVLPVDNIFMKSVMKKDAKPKLNNTAVKDKKVKKTKENYPLLTEEVPPWGVEDLQPMINLVGASPSTTMTTNDISEMHATSIYHNELENSLEYHLLPEAPRHISRVQLRGTQKPSWFPGYYIALPDTIKITRSPSEVLVAAWQAVQPDIFADDSFLVVS